MEIARTLVSQISQVKTIKANVNNKTCMTTRSGDEVL